MPPKIKTKKSGLSKYKNIYSIKEQFFLFFRMSNKHGILLTSQALAFISFFSIIPIYAFFFFILSRLSKDQAIKLATFITELLPTYARGLGLILNDLSTGALNVGILGVFLLGLTAILAYIQIERIINKIWNSENSRKWYQNAYVIISTIVVGPFVVFFLFSIAPYLQYKNVFSGIDITSIGSVFSYLISFIGLTFIVFLLYLYFPFETVNKKSALKSSCIAALAIQLANYGFGFYITYFTSFDIFYGIFAVIPIFLIWLFIIWLIIISGSLLTYINQNYFYGQNIIRSASSLSTVCNALQALLLIMHRFEVGKDPLNFQELCLSTGIESDEMQKIIKFLQDKCYIYPVSVKKKKGYYIIYYQMNKSPSNIFIKDLVNELHTMPVVAIPSGISIFLRETSIHPILKSDMSLREIYYLPSKVLTNYKKFSNLYTTKELDLNRFKKSSQEGFIPQDVVDKDAINDFMTESIITNKDSINDFMTEAIITNKDSTNDFMTEAIITNKDSANDFMTEAIITNKDSANDFMTEAIITNKDSKNVLLEEQKVELTTKVDEEYFAKDFKDEIETSKNIKKEAIEPTKKIDDRVKDITQATKKNSEFDNNIKVEPNEKSQNIAKKFLTNLKDAKQEEERTARLKQFHEETKKLINNSLQSDPIKKANKPKIITKDSFNQTDF